MALKTWNRLDYVFKLMVIVALSIYGIILCRDIVIPLAFAVFLALVLLPVVKRIERRTGTTLAVTIVVVGGMIIFGLLGWLLVNQIINLVADLPNLQERANKFLNDIKGLMWTELKIGQSERNEMVQDFLKSVSVYLGDFLVTTSNTLATVIQIPIYMFLLLIYRDKFKAFFLSLLPDNDEEMIWKKDIENVTQGYIAGLMLVTLIVAALNTIGLLFLGIEHAIFFGILSGILTIIPYVGIFIGALLPTLMALITKDSAWYALGVIAVFFVVQFLEGNFITPRITGSKVSINALAAIIALLLGGKILGIAGMILAVPAIGVLKIMLAYSRRLKPFVILLGDVDKQEVARDPTEHTPPVRALKKEVAEKDRKLEKEVAEKDRKLEME
ncbi:MAG: AI-2E family transporter [Cyclobacteriaceae bacterium]